RSWRRCLEPRGQYLLSLWPRDQGGPGLDELLSRLPGPCGLWRLQAVGHRARNPQDDAGPLSADQEHAGQLQPQETGLLLMPAAGACTAPAPLRGILTRKKRNWREFLRCPNTCNTVRAVGHDIEKEAQDVHC